MRAAEQFGRNADDYRTEPLFAAGEDLRWMRESQELSGAEDLLDVGCGAGHVAMAFSPFVRRCVGVDVTEAMVRAARELAADRGLQNVSFRLAPAERLPFADGAFDLVACRFAAHHFTDIRVALSEAARVLRAGGALLLVDHPAPEDERLDAFINAFDRTRDPSHVRDYRMSEYRSLFAASGLSVEVLRQWDLRLEFDGWARRARVTPAAHRRLVDLFHAADDACRAAFDLRRDDAGRPRSFRHHFALIQGVKG